MGINISVVKLFNKEEEVGKQQDGFIEYKYYTEDQECFDSTRHSNDREFVMQCLHRYEEELDGDSGLVRPKDLNRTHKWIKDNIDPIGNRNRLLQAIDKMKKDETLYFKISW